MKKSRGKNINSQPPLVWEHKALLEVIKKNHLVTDADSYLQGFVEIEISEENYLPHWFAKIYIQPWLGGSEGLSADYQFQIERTSFCRRVLCHLGITYKNLGFVSRASNNNRIADQFTTLSPYLKLGWSFANKVDLLAGYTPLVLGRFKHDDEKASGHLLGLEVFWNYTRRLEQQIILESFSAKSDLGHKLSGQRFGASLGWHF